MKLFEGQPRFKKSGVFKSEFNVGMSRERRDHGVGTVMALTRPY